MTQVADSIRREIENRSNGLMAKSDATDLLLKNALYTIERQAFALKAVADRLDDLGSIVERDGKYDNVGFLRATARRCRELDF